MLLIQHGEVEGVKLEIVPAEDFGPCLHLAANQCNLGEQVLRRVKESAPQLLGSDRAWTVICPEELAKRAVFEDFPLKDQR